MNWTENLCRLCGYIDAKSHSIYKLLDNNETIEFKMKKCLNLKIYEEDFKPKEICDQCLVKIEQFSDFLDVCVSTNEKFETILKNTWNETASMPDYVQPRSVIVNMKDTIEDVHTEELIPMKIGLNLNGDVLEIMQTSDVFSGTFQQDIMYYPDCNNTVLRHSNMEIYPNYDCPKPNETQTTETKKTKQLISVEEIKNQINYQPECQTTNKVKKKHKCPYCERCFVQRITLNSHMAIHTKNKPYICSVCSKSFAIRSELTIHKKIHSDQYQCEICLKTFVVPSKLKRHLRTHTMEKPYGCKVCGKLFSDRSNLTEHANIHSSERNLKCEKCDKLFKTKSQLKSHKLSHNTNSSYTCDICKKSYKYKTNLILHMKKHTGYRCPFCNVNCEKLNALIRHRKECNKR